MTPPPSRIHRPVLMAVLAALQAIFGEGARAEPVVEGMLRGSRKWGARDRRVFAETVYELVRWWRREAWRAGVPEECAFGPGLGTDDCVRIWAAWWLDRGRELPPLPEFALVWAELSHGAHSIADAPAAVRASLPDWIDSMSESAMGASWPALRDALNEPADVWLRANTLRASPDAVVRALAREGVSAEAAPALHHPDSLRLVERRQLGTSAAFRSGLFEVQDAGSQQIAPFVQPRPGERIIDSCAGAGGKSLHLAALMRNSGQILASDVYPWKLDTLKKRAARARITCIECVPLVNEEALARLVGTADRVLIDAPCSGLGVLRRHPDTKWQLSRNEIDRLTALQANLLDSHSRLLKPRGTLVYATCSFLPEENQNQIRAFLSRQPSGSWILDEERLILPNPAIPELNHDAFYMARLRAAN
ncbi:MAG: RsmB/NOP family class I SAM-dependent RNA methyltransferase [Verrucomicrobiales bacterium]